MKVVGFESGVKECRSHTDDESGEFMESVVNAGLASSEGLTRLPGTDNNVLL